MDKNMLMLKGFKHYRYIASALLGICCMLAGFTSYGQEITVNPDGGLEDHIVGTPLTGLVNNSPHSMALVAGGSIEVGAASMTVPSFFKNVITFKVLEETPKFIPADFDAKVKLTIEYGHSSSGPLETLSNQELIVTYRKSEGVKYDAIKYLHFDGYEYLKVTVVSVTVPTISGINVEDLVQLENKIIATRYHTLNATIQPVFNTLTPPAASPIPDELPVSWGLPSVYPGHNATQLEWAWVETEMESEYIVGGVLNTDLLFANNSTRIDLRYDVNTYSIPLLYDGAGKLYYRVRFVNNHSSGSRVDGVWSAVQSFSFNGHNNQLNWQATTSFAEEGKRKTIVQYYDGSLRARQTVTKDNKTHTVVTAETMYDGEGRAAVQILPTPGIGNIIAYQQGLNRFNGQAITDDPAKFFDLTTVSLPNGTTEKMDKTKPGSAKYYSDQNEETASSERDALPDAEGYPYTVTRFYPDATGRVMAQSGVGAAMKMGSNRETKYYYGTPTQEELDGLFGTEVGNKGHYFKNMVRDANGQMSVSYSDMYGRTIITALAGESPDNLVKLNSNQPGQEITSSLLDPSTNVVKDNRMIESVTSLLVPARTLYTFKYTLTPESLSLAACDINGQPAPPVCYDCMYDLEIAITDESGEQQPIIRKFSNIRLDADDNCATPAGFFRDSSNLSNPLTNKVTLPIELEPGSYSIRKTLTISESSIEKFREDYITKGLCTTEAELVLQYYQEYQTLTGCNTAPPTSEENCSACLVALGNNETQFAALNYANTPGMTTAEIHAAYVEAKKHCYLLCGNSSQMLPTKRQLMLQDMMPAGGQYAVDAVPATPNSMYYKYNIFSTTGAGTRPFYKNPKVPFDGGIAQYYTPQGTRDEVIHETPSILANMQPDQFAQLFSQKWAESLLPYHPEYERLLFAEANLQESYNWINRFNNANSFAVADQVGNKFIFTSDANINDPYYGVAGIPSGDKPGMATRITTNYREGKTMWQMAYAMVKCNTATTGSQFNTCMASVPAVPAGVTATTGSYGSISSTEEKDKLWQAFKGLYMAERDQQVDKFIAESRPLLAGTDESDLLAQKYILRFPRSYQQQAQQYGNQPDNDWSFWPPAAGAPPTVLPGNSSYNPASIYTDRCDAYIQRWRQSLLQCSQLAGHPNKEAILTEITTRMKAVCIKGSNQANPYGSSTVPPSTPPNTGDRSFEEIILDVFAHASPIIPGNEVYCNPFVIEAPGPYNTSRPATVEVVSVIDTCNCSRFAQIKTEATTNGYNSAQLSSLNQYLQTTYGDTITVQLFNALNRCNEIGSTTITCKTIVTGTGVAECGSTLPAGCSFDGNNTRQANTTTANSSNPGNCPYTCYQIICDTVVIRQITLSTPSPLPDFMKCGFVNTDKCLNCAELSQQVLDFETYFAGKAWSAAPVISNVNLTEAEISYNNLFARFVNFRTGFQYTWVEYLQAAATAGCDLNNAQGNTGVGGSVPANLVVDSRSGNTPQQYKATTSIEFVPDFDHPVGDDFETIFVTGGGEGPATQNVICRNTRPLTDTTGLLVPLDPCEKAMNMAIVKAKLVFGYESQRLLAEFERQYRAKCLAARDIEEFTVAYENKEYHYTLYYYDQAGNLVKTVPPKGVQPNFSGTWLAAVKNARAANQALPIAHELITDYRYNSLNQVVAQKSPDGGMSEFWYDRLGRLAVSQNAQQKDDGKYSYTLYDNLGRITEVGQRAGAGNMTQAIAQNETDLATWLSGSSGEQVTFTVYDAPNTAIAPELVQQNLRNRVSYSGVKASAAADNSTRISATYYSYDIHGNVDILLQDYKGIPEAAGSGGTNQFKKTRYYYDLISGKVNEVAYQQGQKDAFYHRYEYDAENRLTGVETSRDHIVWEKDAAYNYYKHGPLARTRLGQLQVQGLDYAYTIQGWLKGVNTTAIGDGARDIGHDGLIGGSTIPVVARDVLGFALHYYDHNGVGATDIRDYKPIGASTAFARPDNNKTAFKSLYNGNIGAMTVNIGGFAKGIPAETRPDPLFYMYKYDQLNRLVNMDAFEAMDVANNNWSTATALSAYKESVVYDPNGNILNYNRKGADLGESGDLSLNMDELAYEYIPGTNQLRRVGDNPTYTDNYTQQYSHVADIDNQPANNYSYDKIGNLVKDKAELGTGTNDGITWTVYGKIEKIIKNGTTIRYTYDASGNRISKTAGGKTTLYVRDASGNVMSVYEAPENNTAMVQKELHIYGSSRLGMATGLTTAMVTNTLPNTGDYYISTFTRGEKLFELSNHLGNVLTTVSDKKLQVQSSVNGQLVGYYLADIMSANDYYPFGMAMPGRTYSAAGAYRYGFNGKENDNEVKGEGNQQDYGMRIYDPRLGKFLSVDPLRKKYPFYSPYQFAGNTPIWASDLDGAEPDPKSGNIKSNFNFTNTNSELISNEKFNEIKSKILSRLNTTYSNSGLKYNGNNVSGTFSDVSGSEKSITTAETRSASDWTFQVNILPGTGVADANLATGVMNIYENDPDAASHEYGHLLGLSDRYAFYARTKQGSFAQDGTYRGSRVIIPGSSVTIPTSIDPRIDGEYFGNESENLMFNGSQNGLTSYQLAKVFNQQAEPDWGGNNVYLGNIGNNNLQNRFNMEVKLKPALTVNSAGEIGYWQMTKSDGVHFVNMLQSLGTKILGWYNDISGAGDAKFGAGTVSDPRNSNYVPPTGSIRNDH